MTWHSSPPAVASPTPCSTTTPPNYRQAKALCATCPVRNACLTAAIEEERGNEDGTFGYRAGMNAKKRRQYARLVLGERVA